MTLREFFKNHSNEIEKIETKIISEAKVKNLYLKKGEYLTLRQLKQLEEIPSFDNIAVENNQLVLEFYL